MTLASNSVTEHLVRGLLGFIALIGAVLVMLHGSMWSIPLALVGAAFLRGCPTCWMIGLMETLTKRAAVRVCEDGSCKNARVQEAST
jgi:hypothetical protein